MPLDVVQFDAVGQAGVPSPRVWKDCGLDEINNLGLGSFMEEQFHGGTPTLPGMPEDGDSASYTYNDGTQGNRVMDFATGTTDNNAASFFSRPLGTVTKNSGQKLWFEADVAVAAIADQGLFVGVAELAALSRDCVADDGAALIGESLIGFFLSSADTDQIDAVYKKDAGTLVTVLSDVTNATAIPSDERAAVAANTFIKLGVRFNGYESLEFYVNGYKVATQTVDSTVDQAKEYGGIVNLKTGAAAARTGRCSFFRAAAQVRN